MILIATILIHTIAKVCAYLNIDLRIYIYTHYNNLINFTLHIMRFSNFFCPTLKETPKEAGIMSHALLLKGGFIRQTASGIYSFLPLGKKVLNKIISVINIEMANSGALEVIMPTLQISDIWKESNRYNDYGLEMLKIKDRHNRDLIYGPTNEEQITQIFRDNITSYKALPLNLYQIQWKFRDEVRPRFGLLRGREFLMKDAYSFDISEEESKKMYYKMFLTYLNVFSKLGIFAVPMKADTGPVGGDFSHEFILISESGESNVYLDQNIITLKNEHKNFNYNNRNLEDIFNKFNQFYAVTEEQFNENDKKYLDNKNNIISTKGIEVGQLFYFGTKYSLPMKAMVLDNNGKQVNIYMGSYGIGVSRLVAAIAESSFDEKGIIWPKEIAPFDLIINSLSSNKEVLDISENVYNTLINNKVDVLYNDTKDSVGSKLNTADLIGIPWQLNIGNNAVREGYVELKNRKTNKISKLAVTDLINELNKYLIT